jgi:hypothetical protein
VLVLAGFSLSSEALRDDGDGAPATASAPACPAAGASGGARSVRSAAGPGATDGPTGCDGLGAGGGGWLASRAGAVSRERLRVRVGLEVFLAKPDCCGAAGSFCERAHVVDALSIAASVDHCIEPAAGDGTYRQGAQIDRCTASSPPQATAPTGRARG